MQVEHMFYNFDHVQPSDLCMKKQSCGSVPVLELTLLKILKFKMPYFTKFTA